ncbi:prolyl oligopeptidase family serine peptidase [Rhizobium sp. ICMP 5592]|uniref:alpha/beta hydrolase family protein n=1 Tax=Rhizobium sp. ICMP 5592 TaxID=2292445 RepID=UPI0012968EA0|nr:prolyl oligopeptidase family serine peptidase [Rhizobium sp. ICMP 5592]MQB45007.1 dienelactone hydrolase [Rhizobium sp. ICMP 5592]
MTRRRAHSGKETRPIASTIVAIAGSLLAWGLVAASAMATPPASDAATPVDRAAAPAVPETWVGFDEIRVPNGSEPPLIGGVWYPTTDEPHDVALDSFSQRVALDGSVKNGGLPLVVLSHGGGESYGGHFDTALALARAGFIVAAISHAGDTYDDQSKVMMLWRRPAQLSRLIDYMVSNWRGHTAIDTRRIGAYGFSNGGFTVLVAAGGVPDLMRIDPYCASNPTHDLCTALAQAGVRSVSVLHPPSDVWKPDRRIKAIAAAAPAFGFTFDRIGLASVRVPVMLWGAADDRHQPSPWYEDHIRDALPREPEYHVEARAGHFAFLPPCSARLLKSAPKICADAPGFDRADFHRRLNAELIRFFQANLR